MLIFGWINRKAWRGKTSWIKYGIRFVVNVLENICQICLPIIFTFIVLVIIIIVVSYFAGFTSDKEWIINSLNINFLNPLFAFLSYFSKFNINSPAESNQLSLAGFYFSLAVGGTVILSIVDRCYRGENLLRNELLGQVKLFNEMYSESLSLNLSDVISFDYAGINFRRPNIKKIIYLNTNYIKNFTNTLSQIQTKLRCKEIEERSTKINLYNTFLLLVIITYIIGIITIFVPKESTTNLLWVFIIFSVFSGTLIFIRYGEYKYENM